MPPRTMPSMSGATLTHVDLSNALRFLAMDAVEAAQSGHPGMPLGMADVATVLFQHFLKFNPEDPTWPDRDRLILSAGHGSMLLYAANHLAGYPGMTLNQLKNFRKLGSHTAGHPEHNVELGIETTTGPLAQGLGNAVGMALAERLMAATFGPDLVDHYTYVIAGDGCLMEGLSHEAISLAGHLKLSKLIVLFDDNAVSIDGATDLSVSDDQLSRFAASGWATTQVDGHDPRAIYSAISDAKRSDQPTLIACVTTIGKGAPTKAGGAGVHGSPLGEDEIARAREAARWTHPAFVVPDEITNVWRQFKDRVTADYNAWQSRHMNSSVRLSFDRRTKGHLPANWADSLQVLKEKFIADGGSLATRVSSGQVLDALAVRLPELLGGSADLTPSNNTKAKGMTSITPGDFTGRYVHYGVREHAMGAALNGLTLHGGVIPYGGTFLAFSDYCRPSIRLAALMGIRSIFVMTHDSIGLGEDGPTHQPVEHLAALRAIPNLNVLRPADAVEVAECWQIAIESEGTPSLIALTRQGVPTLRAESTENLSARGGYILREAKGTPRVVILATGSEVHLATQAQETLETLGIATRVVSLPCWRLFDAQDAAYRAAVLGDETVLRIGVEAAVSFGWDRYLGPRGIFIGMQGFGASAPAPDLYQHFGITAAAIVQAAQAHLKN